MFQTLNCNENYGKFGTVLSESEEGSNQRVENSAISTDNSEDSPIFDDSDHDPFDAESEEDDEHTVFSTL